MVYSKFQHTRGNTAPSTCTGQASQAMTIITNLCSYRKTTMSTSTSTSNTRRRRRNRQRKENCDSTTIMDIHMNWGVRTFKKYLFLTAAFFVYCSHTAVVQVPASASAAGNFAYRSRLTSTSRSSRSTSTAFIGTKISSGSTPRVQSQSQGQSFISTPFSETMTSSSISLLSPGSGLPSASVRWSRLYYGNDRDSIGLDRNQNSNHKKNRGDGIRFTNTNVNSTIDITESDRNSMEKLNNDKERVLINGSSSTTSTYDKNQLKQKNQQQQLQNAQEYKNKKLNLQLLLIDNYDSYTYNLYSYLCTICKYEPIVISNDAYKSWDDLVNSIDSNQLQQKDNYDNNGEDTSNIVRGIDGIVISPGPGRPERSQDMGICLEAIEKNPNIPILGVCLGHQALGYYYNATVSLSPSGPVHGLLSSVWYHENQNDNDDDHGNNGSNNNRGHNDRSNGERGVDQLIGDTIPKAPQSSSLSLPPRCNLFDGIPQFFDVVRYHSLVVQFPTEGKTNQRHDNGDSMLDIEPIAWCKGGDPSLKGGKDVFDLHQDHNSDDNTESKSEHDPVCMALQHKVYPHYGVQFHPESVGTGEMGYKILENFCNSCLDWINFHSDVPRTSNVNEQIHSDDSVKNLETGRETKSNPDDQKSDSITSPKYKVLLHKVDSDNNENLPSPEKVFEELYASQDNAFWLDSSTGRRNADLDQNTSPTRSSSENHQCPIISNSRFSIMGCNDGPLGKRIEYWGHDHPSDKRGVYVYAEGRGKNKLKIDSDLISFLRDEVSQNGVTTKSTMIDFLDDKGQEILARELEEDDSSTIPFEYRGGYVGYLGYEVRHDTRQSICEHEICNLSENILTKGGDKDTQVSNPNVPTAAFLFTDRSLVYDHWRGDWFVLGITENSSEVLEKESVDGVNETVVSWIYSIAQRLKTMDFDDGLIRKSGSQLKALTDKHSSLNFSLVRSKEQYTKDIERCHKEIKNGESYELCLTNQFQTTVSLPRDQSLSASPFGLYKILRRKNPAPFAAFLKFENKNERDNGASVSICCSSPERFLSISQNKNDSDILSPTKETHGWEFAPPFVSDNMDDTIFIIESKPIKGTTKRKVNMNGDNNGLKEDMEAAEELRTSVKNRAENLMIVDLLRNDLSRVCEPGSVHVPKLMAIESFATVHQMVSTIRGLMKNGETPIDVISACFPGGSMTGAPKLRSIDILNEMELEKSRGPYSGCLGYISLNGCMDMNIVIRTAILTPGNTTTNANTKEGSNSDGCSWDIAIGAGGAITALSESEDEFDEMQLKSRAVKDAIQEWYDDNCT